MRTVLAIVAVLLVLPSVGAEYTVTVTGPTPDRRLDPGATREFSVVVEETVPEVDCPTPAAALAISGPGDYEGRFSPKSGALQSPTLGSPRALASTLNFTMPADVEAFKDVRYVVNATITCTPLPASHVAGGTFIVKADYDPFISLSLEVPVAAPGDEGGIQFNGTVWSNSNGQTLISWNVTPASMVPYVQVPGDILLVPGITEAPVSILVRNPDVPGRHRVSIEAVGSSYVQASGLRVSRSSFEFEFEAQKMPSPGVLLVVAVLVSIAWKRRTVPGCPVA